MPNIASPNMVAPVSSRSSTGTSPPYRLSLDGVERLLRPQGVEAQERRCQDEHYQEHAPPHALLERIADHDRHASHPGLVPDGLEVDLLEGRLQNANAVDELAGGNQVGHDLGHVLATDAFVAPDAAVDVDLDAPRLREVCRSTLGDDAPAGEDDDAVADELDFAQKVRVEEDGDAASPELLEEAAYCAPAARIEGARRLVEEEEARRPDEGLREPEPLLHALRHRFDPSGACVEQADELQQLGSLGSPPVEPANRWWRTRSSSAVTQPGKRKSSAR